MDEEEIGTKEAARLLGCEQRHARWYWEKGLLPGRMVEDLAGRKLLVFKRSDVLKFEKPKLGRKPKNAAKKATKDKAAPTPKPKKKKDGA